MGFLIIYLYTLIFQLEIDKWKHGEKGKEKEERRQEEEIEPRSKAKICIFSNLHASRAGFQGTWLEGQRMLALVCFQSRDPAKAMEMQTRYGSAFL